MEISDEHISDLKSRFDKLVSIPADSYRKLWPYITWKEYKAGSIIKMAGQQEYSARFLIQGNALFGVQKPEGNKVARILIFENELAFDPISFNSGKPSNYYIKALTDLKTCELKREHEEIVLSELPEFINLSVKLNHVFQEKIITWFVDFLSLGPQESFNWLNTLSKDLKTSLQVQEVKDILGVSRSTMYNLRKKQVEASGETL